MIVFLLLILSFILDGRPYKKKQKKKQIKKNQNKSIILICRALVSPEVPTWAPLP